MIHFSSSKTDLFLLVDTKRNRGSIKSANILNQPIRMLTKVFGSAVFGVEATTITVEVNVNIGVGYHLVGLPDNAIKESNYRIAAALLNNGCRSPGKKITLNLAPADLRKEGSAYDLTLAIGILTASAQIKSENLERYVIMGELSLDGGLHSIKGALPIAIKAQEEGFEGFILPKENAREAAIVSDLKVYGVENISEVIDFFDKGEPLEQTIIDTREEFYKNLDFPEFDFSDVRGQESIKRCMEIVAAGGHNIIIIGPPVSGKTMLAKRLPSILQPMTLHEALETTKIHSVVGEIKNMGLMSQRPFRSPHHTISDVVVAGCSSQGNELSRSMLWSWWRSITKEIRRTNDEVRITKYEGRTSNFVPLRLCTFYLVPLYRSIAAANQMANVSCSAVQFLYSSSLNSFRTSWRILLVSTSARS